MSLLASSRAFDRRRGGCSWWGRRVRITILAVKATYYGSVALYGREKWKLDSHAGGQAGRVSTGVRNSTGKFANYGCQ